MSNDEQPTRRQFLKEAGIKALGATTALTGLAAIIESVKIITNKSWERDAVKELISNSEYSEEGLSSYNFFRMPENISQRRHLMELLTDNTLTQEMVQKADCVVFTHQNTSLNPLDFKPQSEPFFHSWQDVEDKIRAVRPVSYAKILEKIIRKSSVLTEKDIHFFNGFKEKDGKALPKAYVRKFTGYKGPSRENPDSSGHNYTR